MVPAMILLVREHTDTDDSHTQTAAQLGKGLAISKSHHDITILPTTRKHPQTSRRTCTLRVSLQQICWNYRYPVEEMKMCLNCRTIAMISCCSVKPLDLIRLFVDKFLSRPPAHNIIEHEKRSFFFSCEKSRHEK